MVDERPEEGAREQLFNFEGGIVEFVNHLNEGKKVIGEPIYFSAEKDGVSAEVAMQYNDGFAENIYSYANNINTFEGGTHLSGFQGALTRTINAYIKNINALKNEKSVSGSDTSTYPHAEHANQFSVYVELGMTPMQAIQSATTVAAESLGWVGDTGAVAPGYFADIIAVDGDPLDDITVLENVQFVMKGGQVVKSAE